MESPRAIVKILLLPTHIPNSIALLLRFAASAVTMSRRIRGSLLNPGRATIAPESGCWERGTLVGGVICAMATCSPTLHRETKAKNLTITAARLY
jgi:hypothetical protein